MNQALIFLMFPIKQIGGFCIFPLCSHHGHLAHVPLCHDNFTVAFLTLEHHALFRELKISSCPESVVHPADIAGRHVRPEPRKLCLRGKYEPVSQGMPTPDAKVAPESSGTKDL